jgi:hypothetical protein
MTEQNRQDRCNWCGHRANAHGDAAEPYRHIRDKHAYVWESNPQIRAAAAGFGVK